MNNTSTFDSTYQVKLAQIAALQGDTTKKYDSVYQTELEILKKLEEGIGGALIDDLNTSTGTVWSSYKTLSEIQASTDDYLLLEIGTEWTAEKAAKRDALVAKYGSRLQGHLFYKATLPAGSQHYVTCLQYTLGCAVFLEWYNSQRNLYFTTINDNIAVGSTIQAGLRDGFPNSSQIYGRIEIDQKVAALNSSIDTKQDTLVSGTNIKTINNNSILGSGDIEIQGGGAGVVSLTQAEYNALAVKDPSVIYNITDASVYVMEDYATKAQVDSSFGALDTKYNPYNTTTARNAGYLPTWNARGQITGTGNYMYQSSGQINGTGYTYYRTTSSSLPNIYAPTSVGTAGQVLQSTGSGAPQWVDFRSDATYYISESDCSAGTYSNDIAAFYADCISSQHVGPMQLVNNTSHNIGTAEDVSVSQVLNTDVYFVVKDGSTATFSYNGHTISIDTSGNISDPDATSVISHETVIITFGYHTYKTAETVSVTAGDVYLITTQIIASQSYYYPSSTRMFSGNVELWFFTTETGANWRNLHVLITNSTVTADVTTGTFGS